MANYARLYENTVLEICPEPSEYFHPDIAREFIPVPDYVKVGFIKSGRKWIDPAMPIIGE